MYLPGRIEITRFPACLQARNWITATAIVYVLGSCLFSSRTVMNIKVRKREWFVGVLKSIAMVVLAADVMKRLNVLGKIDITFIFRHFEFCQFFRYLQRKLYLTKSWKCTEGDIALAAHWACRQKLEKILPCKNALFQLSKMPLSPTLV